MPPRALGSPLLLALLRALVFVGVTEAIFLRLLPASSVAPSDGLLGHLRVSLEDAGSFTFFLAFLFVTMALINASYRTLRHRLWPGGLNGTLAVGMLCLAALGISAMVMEHGPAFAIGFTLLALVTALLIAMHAYSTSAGTWPRLFAVCYGGTLVSSAVGTVARLSGGIAALDVSRELASRATSAGEILLAASGVASFMAFFDFERRGELGGATGLAFLMGALAATGFAVGCLIAPGRVALLGPDVAVWRVLMLSTALFLTTMTATASLLDPSRRLQGYGLLLLLLAGFPLRIAYQHMMVVLGSVLLFAPEPIDAASTDMRQLAEVFPVVKTDERRVL